MKSVVLLVYLHLVAVCAADVTDSRLIGTWHSNRELSAATIRPTLKVSPEKQNHFLSLFGVLTVTYSADSITAKMPPWGHSPEWKYSTSYHVVKSTHDTVTFQPHDWPIGKNEPTVVHFVSPDRYWISIETPSITKINTANWREYFDRIAN